MSFSLHARSHAPQQGTFGSLLGSVGTQALPL
jgi:hypothetical protein